MFKGSIVAIVTPFRNGAVDEEKLRELVEFLVTGTRVREERPKQDRTAFAVVEPPAQAGGKTGSA